MGLQLLGPLVVHCLLLPACPAYLAQLDEPLGLAAAPPATAGVTTAGVTTAGVTTAGVAAAAAGVAAAAASANGSDKLSAKARKAAATEASLRKTDALRVRRAPRCYTYYGST